MKKVLISILFLATVLLIDHRAAGQNGSNSLNDQLFYAALSGDTAAVQRSLDKGANIEAKNDMGETPLIVAAVRDQREVVKLLLDKGANISAKDGSGETALERAVGLGQEEVAKLLREHGAR